MSGAPRHTQKTFIVLGPGGDKKVSVKMNDNQKTSPAALIQGTKTREPI